ncbi:MAG: 6-bladed beta-propeller [Rikenellaceae bacterium]
MRKLTILITFIVLTSCQSPIEKVATNENGIITADITNFKDTVNIALSELLEDIEIIQLDNEIEAYVTYYSSLFASENYIAATHNNQVKLFERKTSKFICNIGSVGRGHGEYTYPQQIKIHEDSKTIYIGSFQNILAFDFNGKFLHSTSTHDTTAAFDILTGSKQGDVIIYSNYPHYTRTGIIQQDVEGNETSFCEIELPIGGSYNFSNNSTLPNIHIYNLNNKPDTLFRYNKETNSITPIFTAAFNNLTEVEEISKSSVLKQYYENSDYFLFSHTNINPIRDDGHFIGFSTNGYPDIEIVNKKNLTGGHLKLTNDLILSDKNMYIKFKEDYYISGFDAIKLLEHFESLTEEQRAKADPKNLERIDRLIETINPEGNTVMLVGKIK